MRELIAFPCEGETLAGTLDGADGATGLLIVSGGNEIRCGAHRGMALLAADLAAGGVPVLRFDRRGIGDSEGSNRGWEHSSPDIAAAAQAFRTLAPNVRRITGFGNCDAATALAMFHRTAGIDSLVLANPWVGDEGDNLPPADAIRSLYAGRAKDPRQWLRLATGGINISKAIKGLRKASAAPREVGNQIAERMAAALADTPHRFLLANRDNTAIRFAGAWPHGGDKRECATDSHSFARAGDAEWLASQLREALA
ncbi:hydrolase 1, exosortase A system-associated [Sphingomonas sp.]|jgi:exosortase A-associated hydrolase 1|uniref:hydrolase 1, exosortase A system-associated n=1 Tax=Sphingomonas sp. TaxID=28214 RepID=UPI002E360283|nr:hydrolase 1, exosortase A system-associated [Sphingomonas sp.]HEX4693946.1 hydrolase 1, exosortase A system-associated [Sphingomonas sp.]